MEPASRRKGRRSGIFHSVLLARNRGCTGSGAMSSNGSMRPLTWLATRTSGRSGGMRSAPQTSTARNQILRTRRARPLISRFSSAQAAADEAVHLARARPSGEHGEGAGEAEADAVGGGAGGEGHQHSGKGGRLQDREADERRPRVGGEHGFGIDRQRRRARKGPPQ